jgi:hypothetical protein
MPPTDPLSTPQIPPRSDEIATFGTVSPEVTDTPCYTRTHIRKRVSPTPKPTDDIICKVMSHFRLYCTGVARSPILYADDIRRQDVQAAIALLRSRLRTPEDEALFYQLMRHLPLKLPWLASAEKRKRENVADRKSLAVLELGWDKCLSQQL